MRAVACAIVLTCCLGLPGCSLFGKRAQTASNADTRSGAEANLAARSGREAPAEAPPPPPDLGGILAGQVIDTYNRRPPPTSIQVVSAQETKGSPIDVPTDKNGYFTILGLQPGQRYQLIARARDGDHLLAGTTWAVAPSAKLLIRISEDFATPNTPPLPASPSLPGAKALDAAEPKAAAPAPSSPNALPRRAAELTPPIKIAEGAANEASNVPPAPPTAVPPSRPELRPENVTAQPDVYAQRPPTTAIAPWWQNPPPPSPGLGKGPSSASTATPVPAVPTPVPSCVLTGKRLYNLALYDVNGQVWEFQHHRRGRLVLLDFWGTWCPACLEAIPHLNILQSTYGPQGLEVLGIAYEEGSPTEQIQKLERLQKIPGRRLNYRVLLGSERDSCPVLKQFEVVRWPTLVLVDETGELLWRGEGLDRQNLRELELRIQKKLRASRKN